MDPISKILTNRIEAKNEELRLLRLGYPVSKVD
jgi:hypothetical protein